MSKYFHFFLALFSFFTSVKAQNILLTKNGNDVPISMISKEVFYFLDSTKNTSFSEIQRKQFYPFQQYFKEAPKFLPPNKTLWIKFTIKNDFEKDSNIVFYSGFQNYVEAFEISNEKSTIIAKAGNLFPAATLSLPSYRQALKINLKASQSNTYLIKIKNISKYEVDVFNPKLMSITQLALIQERQFRRNQPSSSLFFMGMGMFLIMLIYILIKWIYQKDSTYFYYALSIFSSSLYFLFNFFKTENNQNCFAEFPLLNLLITDSFIFLSQYAYWVFVRKFLYLDKENNFLSKYLKYGSWAILIIGFLSLVYALSSQNIMGLININSKIAILFLLAGAYVLIAIRKLKQPLRIFIYGGIFSLISFSSLASVFEILRETKYAFFTSLNGGTPLIMIGFVVEMLFFTVGLAYRSKLETDQIANIERQKNEAELKAIRAQMNPHFIFNCMNTIDAYIFKEQPEKASAFLNKFSKLIRQTLENSQHSLISLSKEMETLRIFIALELERFEHSFNSEIEIADNFDLNKYQIPPLLIQPYVENAILHGLRNKKNGNGALKIILKERPSTILIQVIDNGIGRKRSAKINQEKGMLHTSLALELTKQRLAILPKKGKIDIHDFKQDEEPGTIVTIFLPIIIQ